MAKYRIFKRTEKSEDMYHEINEDHYMLAEYCLMNDEKLTLMVVADGMGGLEAGEKASYYAIKGFMQSVYNNILEVYLKNDSENFSLTHYADKLKSIILTAIMEANKTVCDNADPFVDTGTTLSVIAVLGGFAVVANTGDSPVYYYRRETDEFLMVSKLHTKAEQDVEAGKYTRFSEEYYKNAHIIYKSLGYKGCLMEDDIYVKVIGYIRSGDMFLIGSDGAFGRMSDNEILNIMNQDNEYQILKNLFARAKEDKNDDQTAIFYKVY